MTITERLCITNVSPARLRIRIHHMKTIILCGGTGTRLKEETEFKPKPMVYIGRKPIIWHIMKLYAHFGYNEFILALGYKADYIKSFFLNQKAMTADFTLETVSHRTNYYLANREEIEDFKITFVDTGLETLVGERILRCAKYVPESDKDFMVTYGDGVSDVSIDKLVEFHKQQKTAGTLTGVHPRSRYGMLELAGRSFVTNIKEKPVLSDWINGGFMIFKREAFKYLRRGEMEHPALRRLAKKKQLSIFKHEGFWFSVDTYKELEDINALWNAGKTPWKVWE